MEQPYITPMWFFHLLIIIRQSEGFCWENKFVRASPSLKRLKFSYFVALLFMLQASEGFHFIL